MRALFFLTSIVVSAVIVGLKTPNLTDVYHNLVTELLLSVIPDPAVVDGYAKSLLPVFQVSVLSFGVAFAVAFRASLGRRTHDPAECSRSSSWCPPWSTPSSGSSSSRPGSPWDRRQWSICSCSTPSPVSSICRVALTSFELPRKTQLPIGRNKSSDLMGDAVVIICVVTALAVVMAGAIFLYSRFGRSPLSPQVSPTPALPTSSSSSPSSSAWSDWSITEPSIQVRNDPQLR